MQRSAQILALQHAPKPIDLIGRLEERVIAEDGHVLPLDDILDLADCFGRDIPNPLKMQWNEHKLPGIDMPLFDESPGLLRTATGVGRIH